MAVLACKNITINFPKESTKQVLQAIQRLQVVELREQQTTVALPENMVNKEAEIMHQIEVANKAYDAIATLAPKKGALSFLADERIAISSEEFADAVEKKSTLLSWAEDITVQHDEQIRLRDEQEALEQTIHTVQPLRDVDVKIFGDFQYVAFVPFFVHETRNDSVLSDIQKRFPEAVVEAIDKMNDEYVNVAAVAKEDREALVAYLMDNATMISVDTTVNGSFHDVFTQSSNRLEEVKNRIAEIDAFMAEKANHIESMAVLKDVLHSEIKTLFAWHSLKETGDTYIVEGYLEPGAEELVTRTFDEMSGVSVSVTEGSDQTKVVMKNNWFVKPFEIVTQMMGTPLGNGIDPTPLLAMFFVFMYGLALSEAGYGLVCAILTGVLLLVVKNMKQGPKSLFTIIFYASISTVVVGAIFGSWFGVTPSDINIDNPDQYLPHTRFLISVGVWPLAQKLQLLNPLQQILTLMIAMGVLGIFHLMVGLALSVRQYLKRGEPMEAFFAAGSWMVFLTLIILNVLNMQGMLGEAMKNSSVLTIIFGVYFVIMIPIVGRESASWFGKFAKGAFDLFFGAIGYISDILSYTRLVALGLATGIIAAVVNTLAALAGGGLANSDNLGKVVIGYVIMLVIFLGGHLFNIALNVLGSYITVGRLHFVEFFGKFFESGGQELQPLSPSEEYIRIVK